MKMAQLVETKEGDMCDGDGGDWGGEQIFNGKDETVESVNIESRPWTG
jgi:hypothetical protein